MDEEELREGIGKTLYEQEFSAGYWDTQMTEGDKSKWKSKADKTLAYARPIIEAEARKKCEAEFALKFNPDYLKFKDGVEAGKKERERIFEQGTVCSLEAIDGKPMVVLADGDCFEQTGVFASFLMHLGIVMPHLELPDRFVVVPEETLKES